MEKPSRSLVETVCICVQMHSTSFKLHPVSTLQTESSRNWQEQWQIEVALIERMSSLPWTTENDEMMKGWTQGLGLGLGVGCHRILVAAQSFGPGSWVWDLRGHPVSTKNHKESSKSFKIIPVCIFVDSFLFTKASFLTVAAASKPSSSTSQSHTLALVARFVTLTRMEPVLSCPQLLLRVFPDVASRDFWFEPVIWTRQC